MPREKPKRITRDDIKALVSYLNAQPADKEITIAKAAPAPSDPEKGFRAVLRSPEGIAGLIHFLNTWENIPDFAREEYRRKANEELGRFQYIYRMEEVNGRAVLKTVPVNGPDSQAESMLRTTHDLNVAHDLRRVRLCRCGKWFYAGNERRRFHSEGCRFAARKALSKATRKA